MNPPEHIKGPLSKWTDPAIIQARDDWAADQANQGHSCIQIAEALGVSRFSATQAAKRGGWKPRPVINADTIQQKGMALGRIKDAFEAAPYAARDAIIATCARTGKTVAQVLVDAYVEAQSPKLHG